MQTSSKKINEHDQIFADSAGVVNRDSTPNGIKTITKTITISKTSDAKQQQKSEKMIKSWVIQQGSK